MAAYSKLQLCVAGAHQSLAMKRQKEQKMGNGTKKNGNTTPTSTSSSDNNCTEDNGKLGLLYLEVVPDSSFGLDDGFLADFNGGNRDSDVDLGRRSERRDSALTLAQRMKDVANINLTSLREGGNGYSSPGATGGGTNRGTGRKPRTQTRESVESAQTVGLIRDVLQTLAQQEKDRHAQLAAEESEFQRAADLLQSSAGVINLRGWVDRKVQSAVVWKRSWMQLTSRPNKQHQNGDGDDNGNGKIHEPYIYTLMWAFEQGGKIAAAFNVQSIHSVRVVDTPWLQVVCPPLGQREGGSSMGSDTGASGGVQSSSSPLSLGGLSSSFSPSYSSSSRAMRAFSVSLTAAALTRIDLTDLTTAALFLLVLGPILPVCDADINKRHV